MGQWGNSGTPSLRHCLIAALAHCPIVKVVPVQGLEPRTLRI